MRCPRIGLSTASVYPESTAHAFALRRVARLRRGRGDGRHRRAEPADRRRSSSSPTTTRCRSAPSTRRACSSPSGSGAPSRGASSSGRPRWPHAVGADVVVVHPPFRWQKEYAARLRRRHRGAGGVDRASPSRSRTCIRGGPLAPRDGDVPARLGPLRGALRQHHDRPLPRRDRAAPTSIEMAERLGDRLRHIHLTDGTGSAKDEHLVPGPRRRWAPTSSCATWPTTGFAGDVVLEINTRQCADRAEREARPARVAGVRPRAPRRCAPREPREPRDVSPGAAVGARARRTPGPRSSPRRATSFAEQGFGGTTIRAVAAAAGVDAALVHHYFGTKDDLFVAALELPVDPRVVLAPVVAARSGRCGRAAAADLPVGVGRPGHAGCRCSRLVRGGARPEDGERLLTRRLHPGRRSARSVVPLGASTGPSSGCRWSPARCRADHRPLRSLEPWSRWPSMPADDVGRAVRADCSSAT